MKLPPKDVELMIVTPETAREWLRSRAFPRQRPVTQEWVEELAVHLRNGLWEGGLIKMYQVNDRWLLIDGHHRLLAIVLADMPAWANVEWTANSTMDAAEAAYARTDGGMPRTLKQGMTAVGFQDRTGLKQSCIEKVLYAARFIANGYRDAGRMKSNRSTDTKIAMASEWAAEGKLFFAATHGVPAHIGVPLRTAGPLSVALTVFRHQPEPAGEFFRTLAANNGLEKGEPIHTLTLFLSNPNTRSRSQAYRARAVASCWNAWKKSDPIIALRPNEDGALYLEGTPLRYRRPGSA